MRLEGKVALLTGAATGDPEGVMGIGGATAWLFAREGATVVLTDIDDALGERTAAQIAASGRVAVYMRLDARLEDAWATVMESVVRKYDRLDILVNNAGSAKGARVPIEDATLESWEALLTENATSCFLGTRQAIPVMRGSGGGSIVNISSIAGLVGETVPIAGYQAGKGAVRIFTKAAAVQYAADNIRVNSVHPGYTATPTRERMAPEFREQILTKVPLGREATAEDIANGILYLASEESSYVTGAELVIDGGVTAQ